MNRLQKKCVIMSAGFHLSLALILVVGPGFFAPKNMSEDPPTLDIIPDKVIDGAFRSGAPSKADSVTPPPPAPSHVEESRPAPKPPEPKHTDPEPSKIKEQKSVEPSLELPKDKKKPKIEISTTPITRPRNNSKPTTKPQTSETEVRAREQADAQARRDALLTAANSLHGTIGSKTGIELVSKGLDGYGEAVASYAQVVKSIYEHAWIPPDDAANDDAITKVSVTIANDGTIIESHIVGQSGDSLVDHSVQRTLDRVKIQGIGRPFPEGSKDKQRTYIINFNLKAKRGLG